MKESNHEFHEPTATHNATVAITGRHNGKIILKYILSSDAPANLADSIREGGNEFMYVRMTITLKGPTKAGSI